MNHSELDRIGEIDRTEEVSQAYECSDGAALVAEVIDAARGDKASQLYVSGSPTKTTVDFYQSCGFRPTPVPNRKLLALEPDDIHMTMDL